MTVKEAACVLNCSPSLVYKLTDQGQLAFEWRGRRKLVVRASVADYRKRNLVPANPEPVKPKRRKERYQCEFL